jgi:hypothetical protein
MPSEANFEAGAEAGMQSPRTVVTATADNNRGGGLQDRGRGYRGHAEGRPGTRPRGRYWPRW